MAALTNGSLSLIIYSWACVEECSIASAVRPKRCRQRGPWRNCKSGRIRVGRGEERESWVWDEEEEEEEEEEVMVVRVDEEVDESRWRRRGRRRRPRG
jgi:hypothetical protein